MTLSSGAALLLMALIALRGDQVSLAADVVSFWTGGSGAWSNVNKWSHSTDFTGFPNNAALTFDAVIDASGPAYTVAMNGNISLESLMLDAPGATLALQSGRFSVKAPLELRSGTLLLENATLADCTLPGSAARLEVRRPVFSNVTLGNATLRLGDAARIYFDGTLGGTGEIVFDGAYSYSFLLPSGDDPVIAPGITVRTGGFSGQVGLADQAWTNRGTIVSSTPGQSVFLTGAGWVNEGIIRVDRGSTISLGTEWTNAGTIDVNGTMTVFLPEETHDAVIAGMVSQIKAARDAGWSSQFITSSAARNDPSHLTGLGWRVEWYEAVVACTYNGDANIDGVVDAVDYFLTDSGFLGGNHDWENGDFNYDGKVDATDYFLIDSAFIGQRSLTRAEAIPEPGALGILTILGALMPRCQRRRNG